MSRSLVVFACLAAVALPGCDAGLTTTTGVPACEPSGELVTIAQAVPTARFVPCIRSFPVGWSFGGMEIEDGEASFWLRNDRVGPRAARVTLTPSCDTTGATRVPSDGGATRRSLRIDELGTRDRGTWLHEFSGGCVTFAFSVREGTYDLDRFNVELDDAIDLFPRAALAEEVERRYGAELDEAPPS